MNLAKKGTIISVKQIAKRTIEVSIKVPDDFEFNAGQYIWLMVPELKYLDPAGNTRMFSIASSPNQKGGLNIFFRTGESGYKKTLIEMPPGSEVIFSGPYGPMELPEDKSLSIVFIAGGVGVAPLLSMIRFSDETVSNHKITLVYSNVSEEEAAYIAELEQIEKRNSNFKLIKTFGRLKGELLKQLIDENAGLKTIWHVTGPKEFVNFAGKFLDNNGITVKDIVFEQFYPNPEGAVTLEERINFAITNKYPFFTAVENASSQIIITDTNGVIIYANKGAENNTGYTFQEMKGNTSRLWGGLMPKDFYKNLWKVKKYNLQSFSGEVKNRRKNQDEYYAIIHSSPIFGDNNSLIGFVATEEDITNLKEIDTAKSEFISTASHQLRTPVAALKWLTEELLFSSKGLNPKQLKYVQDLSAQSKRLIELIEDLLNFSRIGLKTTQLKQQVEIYNFLEKFIKEIEPYAVSKKHSIILNKNSTVPLTVEINERSLYNIMQNLLSNAVDYSPENTSVTVDLESIDGFVKISVSNNGPVIPDSEKLHIFEKFYRGESVKKMKQEGTGLGLYIVKSIIEDIGGKVGFESPAFIEKAVNGKEENKVTVFWFTVPVTKQ